MARHRLFLSVTTFTCTVAALIISTKCCCKDSKSGVFIRKDGFGYLENKVTEKETSALRSSIWKRELGSPGSSPPRCSSKCGGCSPCMPVRVAVPPGTPVVAEYYPEVWRCKCGSRLYLPWETDGTRQPGQ